MTRDNKRTTGRFLGGMIVFFVFLVMYMTGEMRMMTKYVLGNRESVTYSMEVLSSPISDVNVIHISHIVVDNVTEFPPRQTKVTTDNVENDTQDALRQRTNLNDIVKNVTDHILEQTNNDNTEHNQQKHGNVADTVMDDIESILEQGPENKKKYLVYFAQSGYANQVRCLKHAYLMARTLNRVLLVPPVLPHKKHKGGTIPFFVINQRSHQFPSVNRREKMNPSTKKLLDPFHLYLERLGPRIYLPLGHVLDLNLTLPGIQSMDVREFYEQVYQQQRTSNMTRAVIEIDYGYSNMNTI